MGKNKTCLIEKAKYLLSITTTVEIIIGTLFSDIIAKPCYILIYRVFFPYIRNLFFALSFFFFSAESSFAHVPGLHFFN